MDKLNSLITELSLPMEKIFKQTIEERVPVKNNEKTVVCQHWLKGMCRKGIDCDFLHRYDEDKLPPCHHYQKFGSCEKPDCPFKHEEGKPACDWYMRGFCKHGKKCKNGHENKLICPLYYMGFCPFGKECKFEHPSLNILAETRMNVKNEKNEKFEKFERNEKMDRNDRNDKFDRNEKEERKDYVKNEKKPRRNDY